MAVSTWLVTSRVLGEEVQELAASRSSSKDACPDSEECGALLPSRAVRMLWTSLLVRAVRLSLQC